MKFLLKIVMLLFIPASSFSQVTKIDSLRQSLAHAPNDSMRYRNCKFIYDHYEETNRDSALAYAAMAFRLADKNQQTLPAIFFLNNQAYQLTGLGRYAEALQLHLEAFRRVEKPGLENRKTWMLFSENTSSFTGKKQLLMLAFTHHMFGVLMWQTDNMDEAIAQFTKAREIAASIGHPIRQLLADMNLGRFYMAKNLLDTAMRLEDEAEQLVSQTGYKKYLGQVYSIKAGIYKKKNDEANELLYYRKAIAIASDQHNQSSLSSSYFNLARYFLEKKLNDSAIHYTMKNLEVIRQLGPVTGLVVNLGTVYENLYLAYKLGGPHDSVFKYQELTLTVKDSLYKIRISNLAAFQNVTLSEQLRLQNAEREKIAYQAKIRTYVLLAGIAVLLLLAIVFYRNNRQKQKAKNRIEKAYVELKAAQAQLIQSEKMASLGELTAGIAHEIQNPLNFVNNFSEVNKELVDELQQELKAGKIDDAIELSNDIKANEEKIIHHGKRADAIVKGMLQHSRSSSGVKEPTDINALCDEYLRLAYHGLRAKDKSFNATMKTDFDAGIGNINIIPQDMGRVILNLITNAFYVVDEKKTLRQAQGDKSYEPTVTVSTKKINGKVAVTVADNGNGIPQKVLDKIFQPFFTTKPTGQGTGLGLSLSYDIVKAHGGEIKVNTKENEGTEFIIQLPI